MDTVLVAIDENGNVFNTSEFLTIIKPGQPMEIIVEEPDIDNGEPNSTDSCPIALRLHAIFPMADIMVAEKEIVISDHGKSYAFSTKGDARRFIKKFDTNGAPAVKPGAIILRKKIDWESKVL